MTTIAWTGHRPDLFADPAAARARLEQAARDLVARDQAKSFLVGGQRGVDTWAALAALDLGLPFTLILPVEPALFADEQWTSADRAQLDALVANAARVTILGGELATAYSRRNHLLAAGADLLVAVWTGTPGGGTTETIDFARALGTATREIILEPSPRARCAGGHGV